MCTSPHFSKVLSHTFSEAPAQRQVMRVSGRATRRQGPRETGQGELAGSQRDSCWLRSRQGPTFVRLQCDTRPMSVRSTDLATTTGWILEPPTRRRLPNPSEETTIIAELASVSASQWVELSAAVDAVARRVGLHDVVADHVSGYSRFRTTTALSLAGCRSRHCCPVSGS